MAFLDNSGDIILDAVLTDTGRLRLAQGDGSFKITKFALGDDEINYAIYNKTHASGSAYYDLEVLQTPILEAFTNNASSLKSKLVSLSRTNVLYMPILKLNRITTAVDAGTLPSLQAGQSGYFARSGTNTTTITQAASGKFYVSVDQNTTDALVEQRADSSATAGEPLASRSGMLQGHDTGTDKLSSTDIIRVDQGLDTNEISANLSMDSDLVETAFIVQMDYRLGRIKPSAVGNDTPAAVNFIDDDNIASYYLSGPTWVNPTDKPPAAAADADGNKALSKLTSTNPQVFEGPRSNSLHFQIQASQELQTSTYLFTQLGTSQGADVASNILGFPVDADGLIDTATTYYIDSTVRVIGANTGYRLDIPVRFVKVVY
jgi:hypothetical protein